MNNPNRYQADTSLRDSDSFMALDSWFLMWQWTDTDRTGAEQQSGDVRVNGYAKGTWSCRVTAHTHYGVDEHCLWQLRNLNIGQLPPPGTRHMKGSAVRCWASLRAFSPSLGGRTIWIVALPSAPA